MPSSSHFEKYPTGWIKIWIGIGTLAFVGFIFIFSVLRGAFLAEQERFLACAAHTSTSCNPSIYWYMNEWYLDDASATSTPLLRP